jgi:hypothetical protein
MFVLTVPLLVLVLWVRTGFRRGDVEPGRTFSLMTDACLDMLPNCSRPYVRVDMVGVGVVLAMQQLWSDQLDGFNGVLVKDG